ncbi:substrate-binding periplasmic protein [Roseateles sp. DC23W]|uniref:Substrate-binding periplasmic protein n=1 Tax=Pelomonas dachongensis TaxID=3299029 RepID=A0ABW7EQM0_9BURK
MSLPRRSVCLLPLASARAWGAGTEIAPLRIGWSDYPPFQHGTAGEPPQGLDVDLLEMLARASGERLQWMRRPWARQMADVARGELDLVPGATPSPDRLVFGDFTQPYRQERVALLALAGEPQALRGLSDLKGRAVRIGAIRGVAFPAAVRRALEDPELARLVVPLHANDLTLSALRSRRVDYVIDDPSTMNWRVAREPGAAVQVVLELAVSPVHLLVGRPLLAQRPTLIQRLNQGLQAARRQPEWAHVLARYPGY